MISVVFSLDGICVVSGAWDCTVHIWNAMTNRLEDVLEPHLGLVKSIALVFLKVAKSWGLSVFSEFGLIYFEAGQWKDVEELDVQVKETYLKLFGAKHPMTLLSMGNLALTYKEQGWQQDAKELQVQVKEAYLRLLGGKHLDTLRIMGNLALAYKEQGQWKDAGELQAQVKEACLRLFGAEHPDTA